MLALHEVVKLDQREEITMADLKQKEKCPVCGMNVMTDDIKAEYKGKSYYFCEESDKKAFTSKPEKYISKSKAA